ncbi:MAG: alpha/beta hydrolase [Leptolinea sp.]|jgi:pimeloyl-ACP methyl ester carboxylesterase|nr:alpha/beta hydrolase [Leptolinea sp.]
MKINLSNLNIYYEVQGKGDNILLLHGWGMDSGNLRDVSTLLKEKTSSRVYSLDLPGFGFSDTPEVPWCVDDYVNLVRSFIESQNLSKVSILGHSFGGRIAIKLAAQYPTSLDRLILVDSAGIIPKRRAGYYFKVYLAKIIKFLKKTFPGIANWKVFETLSSSVGSEDYKRANQLRGTLVRVVNEDLKPCLPGIKARTLLIWGEQDKEVPVSDAKIMKDLISNSQLEIVRHAGHFPHMDNFHEFSQYLLDFWRS